MSDQKTWPGAVCATAVAGLVTASTLGSIEMTWSESPVSTSWNEVQNWVPPAGEMPSVPDTPQEAAFIEDLGGAPATIILDVSPTIDYLFLGNPQGTLHLAGRTLTLTGPGTSINGGLIVADPDICTITGSFWNVGDIELEPGSFLIVHGPEVANIGVIFVNTGTGTADSAVVRFQGDVTLGHPAIPGGELLLNGTETQSAALEVGLLSSLTNVAGHTIRGHGFVQGSAVINEGIFETDPGADVYVACNTFINRGTTIASTLSGETVHVQSGTVDVAETLMTGATVIETGATLTVGDLIPQFGGSMTIDGTLAAGGGVELMSGASMGGSGSVQGAVLNSSGVVGPGGSAGMIELGSYTQQGGGRLVIELGGTQEGEYDVLSVVGAAALAGKLEINALRGLVAPPFGQTFTILTAQGGIASGDTFDAIVPEWGIFSDSYDYEAGTVTITVQSWPLCVAEDVNRDGEVSVKDLLQMLAQWGPCPPFCPSDVNGDTVVDYADFLQLLEAWGQACW